MNFFSSSKKLTNKVSLFKLQPLCSLSTMGDVNQTVVLFAVDEFLMQNCWKLTKSCVTDVYKVGPVSQRFISKSYQWFTPNHWYYPIVIYPKSLVLLTWNMALIILYVSGVYKLLPHKNLHRCFLCLLLVSIFYLLNQWILNNFHFFFSQKMSQLEISNPKFKVFWLVDSINKNNFDWFNL